MKENKRRYEEYTQKRERYIKLALWYECILNVYVYSFFVSAFTRLSVSCVCALLCCIRRACYDEMFGPYLYKVSCIFSFGSGYFLAFSSFVYSLFFLSLLLFLLCHVNSLSRVISFQFYLLFCCCSVYVCIQFFRIVTNIFLFCVALCFIFFLSCIDSFNAIVLYYSV